MTKRPRTGKRAKPAGEIQALPRFDRCIDAINFILAAEARGKLTGIILHLVEDGTVQPVFFGHPTNYEVSHAATGLVLIAHDKSE